MNDPPADVLINVALVQVHSFLPGLLLEGPFWLVVLIVPAVVFVVLLCAAAAVGLDAFDVVAAEVVGVAGLLLLGEGVVLACRLGAQRYSFLP